VVGRVSERPNFDWVRKPADRRRLAYLYDSRRFAELSVETAEIWARQLRREEEAQASARAVRRTA
jgi:hypothetical protein